MNWLNFAKNDWSVYQDKARIAKFVEFNKITAGKYEEIVGEPYNV